jgi:hypothetical protein
MRLILTADKSDWDDPARFDVQGSLFSPLNINIEDWIGDDTDGLHKLENAGDDPAGLSGALSISGCARQR